MLKFEDYQSLTGDELVIELTEKYNLAGDQFIYVQKGIKLIDDLIMSMDRDDEAPDLARNKRKLRQISKIWKDVESSLGPRYTPFDYPHKVRVSGGKHDKRSSASFMGWT